MSIQEINTEQAVEMITCVIDGFEVTVPKGTLVIRAAEKLGIQIPRFCDHPLLAPAGACRQCLVDIEINGRAFPKPPAPGHSRSSAQQGRRSLPCVGTH